VPEVRIVYVGIGEEAGLGAEFLEELRQVLLGKIGMPSGYSRSRQRGRILPPFNARNLRRGESHDSVGGIVAKADVEIMKVAARGPEDDDLAGLPPWARESPGMLSLFRTRPFLDHGQTLFKVDFPLSIGRDLEGPP